MRSKTSILIASGTDTMFGSYLLSLLQAYPHSAAFDIYVVARSTIEKDVILATHESLPLHHVHVLPVVSTHDSSEAATVLTTSSINVVVIIAGPTDTANEADKWVAACASSKKVTGAAGQDYAGVSKVVAVTNWVCGALQGEVGAGDLDRVGRSEAARMIEIENAIKKFKVDGGQGDAWTIVRLGFFLEKLEWLSDDVATKDTLPFLMGKATFLPADVHNSALALLHIATNDKYRGVRTLTGTTHYDAERLAFEFSEALGRQIKIVASETGSGLDAPKEHIRKLFAARSVGEAALTVEEMESIGKGLYPDASGQIELLTGHRAKTVEQWLTEEKIKGRFERREESAATGVDVEKKLEEAAKEFEEMKIGGVVASEAVAPGV